MNTAFALALVALTAGGHPGLRPGRAHVRWGPCHRFLHEKPDRTELILEFARGPCLGACPAFNVEVYADGRIEYEGVSSVRPGGVCVGHLSKTGMAALSKLLVEAHLPPLGEPLVGLDKPTISVVEHSHGQKFGWQQSDFGDERSKFADKLDRFFGTNAVGDPHAK